MLIIHLTYLCESHDLLAQAWPTELNTSHTPAGGASTSTRPVPRRIIHPSAHSPGGYPAGECSWGLIRAEDLEWFRASDVLNDDNTFLRCDGKLRSVGGESGREGRWYRRHLRQAAHTVVRVLNV